MKKISIAGIALLLLPICLRAQFSKKSSTGTDSLQQTVDLKLTLVSDTAKARIVLFARGDTDQFLSWVDGFIITKSYKLPNGNTVAGVGNLAYTSKWVLIKPEDIYDIKLTAAKEQSAR
ncbi:hypothetical protein [Deminuibacter soli]|uniref:Uncharacterized protein n=1 Tax=Deminuibacter soli TaxID=2291815 RepID=A0A3E1NJ34_9BACT|nr:hypothetical protein [Deminuibacter soli]RFM27947.1 hypothetical protein DXN05_10395 [Deminuibacter soli]